MAAGFGRFDSADKGFAKSAPPKDNEGPGETAPSRGMTTIVSRSQMMPLNPSGHQLPKQPSGGVVLLCEPKHPRLNAFSGLNEILRRC